MVLKILFVLKKLFNLGDHIFFFQWKGGGFWFASMPSYENRIKGAEMNYGSSPRCLRRLE